MFIYSKMVYTKKRKTTYRPKRMYKKKRNYKKKANNKKNNSIEYVAYGNDGSRYYSTPVITGNFNTDGELTTKFPNSIDEGVTTSWVNFSSACIPIGSQLQSFGSCFRYNRIKKIKVTFIPQEWTALTLTNQPNGAQDGEKPILNIVSDDGSLALVSGVDDGLTLAEAESQGKGTLRKYKFTKPISIWLKPYSRNPVSKTNNKYFSMSTWAETSVGLTTSGFNTTYIPDLNLWYGFENLPKSVDGLSTPFTFRMKYEIHTCFKDPK